MSASYQCKRLWGSCLKKGASCVCVSYYAWQFSALQYYTTLHTWHNMPHHLTMSTMVGPTWETVQWWWQQRWPHVGWSLQQHGQQGSVRSSMFCGVYCGFPWAWSVETLEIWATFCHPHQGVWCKLHCIHMALYCLLCAPQHSAASRALLYQPPCSHNVCSSPTHRSGSYHKCPKNQAFMRRRQCTFFASNVCTAKQQRWGCLQVIYVQKGHTGLSCGFSMHINTYICLWAAP